MTRLNVLLIALFALTATSAVANMHSTAPEMKFLWNSWKQLNNKVYHEVEEMKRFTIFVENYFLIVAENAKNHGVRLALNKFADLTAEEFQATFTTGLQVDQHVQESEDFLSAVDYSVLAIPDSVDWRQKGAVTPVKNQAKCGSCWAFSSTGALEGLNFIKNGKLTSFSEQQLVDCDHTDNGCNGGLMVRAFAHTAQKGIETEEGYPYKGVRETCKYDAKKAQKVNTGSKNVAANNADALKAAIAIQPVSVAIQADQAAFRFYKSGVVKANCGRALNHGVLAVGYTTVDGEEAFIVKNSWDSVWGNQGYVMISTDKTANNGAGVCGILAMATYPTA